MKTLEISPDFTIEDIHKIRMYNDELRKTMSREEYKNYIKNQAEECKKEMEIFRSQMKKAG
jgi:hypothetical protein